MKHEVIFQKSKKVVKRKRAIFYIVFLMIIAICTISSFLGYFKSLPAGISFEGDIHKVSDVEFLYDVTFEDESGVHSDQVIFSRANSMIKDAEEFVMIDMFLFNDEYDRNYSYPSLSNDLTETLIEKKQQNPDVNIILITDPINTFYGSYLPDHFKRLKQHGVDVVYTDLTTLRDSNPLYSGIWRVAFKWYGTTGDGWLPNPFSPDSNDVTLRSYLELLNFKANHRKVLITEQEALVTSANPHDASSYHSNIAFVVKGEIIQDLINTENKVAEMSGFSLERINTLEVANAPSDNKDEYSIQLLTEGKIKNHMLKELSETNKGDEITVGVFYLSDRDIVKELIEASHREVEVRLILDANKDAFGREKNGVPNRPVAHELRKKSNNKIQIRWYNTNGEQYHTKMTLIKKQNEALIIGGSANLTKRNLSDFNLETNVKISGNQDSELMVNAERYFERLWNNDGGIYTLDYKEYQDESLKNRLLYRIQEFTGLSSF